LTTSVITLIISAVTVLVVMAITFAVVTPVVAVVGTIVVASVIVAVVAVIISSIPVVVATIGPAIAVITLIRSTVTIVEALNNIPVVVVAALGLLRVGRYSKGTLQLLAFLTVCLSSRWNWHWSSMTMLKSPSRKVDGIGGSAM
jgi:hypothetical protein